MNTMLNTQSQEYNLVRTRIKLFIFIYIIRLLSKCIIYIRVVYIILFTGSKINNE